MLRGADHRLTGTKAHAVVLTVAVLFGGCSDSSGPAASSFVARISGARTLSLSGASNGGSVFTEDRPEIQFSIRMIAAGHGDTLVALFVACPGEQPPTPGQHLISPGIEDCRGSYSRILSLPPSVGGTLVIESATASAGQVTIGNTTGDQLEGRFSFTGPLVAGGDSAGTISARGSFSAQVQ